MAPSGTPVLNVPEPPGRYVLPAPDQPTLPQQIEEPAPTSGAPASTTKPVRNPNPRVASSPPPVETPPPTPTPAPAILRTSVNSPEFEQRVKYKINKAKGDLDQVKTPLGTEARAHFDAAKGFIRQAEEALKVKNLIYAGQLADKAATLAALLRK
jgi:hypothetical protein